MRVKKKIARSIIRKIKSKNDILNIKVENILIGDLLYDTFLKSNQIATINYSDEKFFKMLEDFIHLFFYWKNFFSTNKIHTIIGVHSVYSYALPLRIAINKGINAYTVKSSEISKLTKKNIFSSTNFFDYRKKFKKFNKAKKREDLNSLNKS